MAKIRDGHSKGLDPGVVAKLEGNLLISKVGSGKSQRYVLGAEYQALIATPLLIGSYVAEDVITILKVLQPDKEVKMGALVGSFSGRLTREQVKYLVEKLVDDKVIERSGTGNTTTYKIHAQFKDSKDKTKEIEEYLEKKQKE